VRIRRLRLAAALGFALLVLAPTGWALAADSPGGSAIGGFTALANAPGFQMIYDNPGGINGSHPVGYGTVPEATSTMATGPVGQGLASVVWPGPLLGNLGTASGLLPIPGGIPPPAGQAVQQNGNDPIRAEASTGGPNDAQLADPGGAVTMVAHADQNKVTAQATTKGFEAPGAGTTGTIVANSAVTVTTAAVTSQSNSAASNIAMGPAGLVTIDSVTSTATATSDGTAASGQGTTTVNGLKVAGQPATVDQDGLHLGPANTPLGGQINPAVNQAISASGLKMLVTQPQENKQGAAESFQAASLVISFTAQSGDTFTMSFGGATAEVNANTAVPDSTVDSSSTDVSTTPTDLGTGSTPATPDASSGAGSGTAPAGDAVPAPAAAPKPVTAPSAKTGRVALAGASGGGAGGVGTGVAVAGVAAAALAAFGLRRLNTNILAATPVSTACPLEQKKK
jgi:hypothetical protein